MTSLSFRTALLIAAAILGAAALAVYLALYLPFAQRMARGPADLRREKVLAAAEGIPVRAEDLQAAIPAPAWNAAPIYARLAGADMSLPPALTALAASSSGCAGWSRDSEASIETELSRRQPWLEGMVRASQLPDCVFVRDWSQGPDIRFPELSALRTAAVLVRLRGGLEVRKGSYDLALGDVDALFRFSRHAASGPVLLAFVVGQACEAHRIRLLGDLLAAGGGNPSLVQAVRERLGHRPALNLPRACRGETAIMLRGMELLEQGQLRRWPSTYGDGSDLQLPDTPRKPLQGRWSREWLAAGSAWMLDRMRQIDRAAALPSVERLALLERIQRVRPRNRNWMLLGMPPDPSEVLSPFIPSVLRIAQAAGRVETRARLIQSAAAVLTWHDSHGTWPPDLASAGVSPVDPETRLAMHYFGGPEGFVLTAVLPARLQTAGSAGGDPIEFRFGRGQAR